MNERIDITNDALPPLPDTAAELAQQPRHTTSRLALLVVGLVASCSLAVGCFMYWRDSNIALPPIYGVSRTQNDSTGTSTVPEIDESNFEAELAEIELDFQETEAELDMSLDEIDAELEAQFDAQ
jgi:hypothetical protein